MSDNKDTKKPLDARTDQDMPDLWIKWLSLSGSITIILVAGSVLNLIGYFLKFKDDLGFGPFEQELVRWSVAGGYYWGILAGPFISFVGNQISYFLAAAGSLIGFIFLSFYIDENYVSTVSSLVIIMLLFVVSLCAAIATVASVSTVVKNFTGNVAPVVLAIQIGYYMVAPYFEKSIRSTLLEDHSFKSILIYWGIFQAVAYVLAAFLVKSSELSLNVQKASSLHDNFGLGAYILIESIFIVVIYFGCILANKWNVGLFAMIFANILNFLAAAFAVWIVSKKIRETETKNIRLDHPQRFKLSDMLAKPSLYWAFISTFIIVGCGTAFQLEALTVAFAMGQPGRGPAIMKSFWVSDVIMRFLGGIIFAFFSRMINPYIFSAITAFVMMFAFLLALLSQPVNPFFFYFSSFLIGGGVGAFWVLLPQIIVYEDGQKLFENVWGIVIFINVVGVFIFDKVFMWISDKEEPYEVGFWEGYSCYLASYVISAVLCGFAGAIWLFASSSNMNNADNDDIEQTKEPKEPKEKKEKKEKKHKTKKPKD